MGTGSAWRCPKVIDAHEDGDHRQGAVAGSSDRHVAGDHPFGPFPEPAERLGPGWMGWRHLAVVPGGGLLIADGAPFEERGHGILFIGPRGDDALAGRVHAHRQAEAAGDWARARAILDRLARRRDDAVSGQGTVFDLPFVGLSRKAIVRPGLGRDVHRLIGAFLVDPRVVAFRIGLAVETIIDDSEFERARGRACAWYPPRTVATP